MNRNATEPKRVTRVIDEVKYTMTIPEGGQAGGIVHILPNAPNNDVLAEFLVWTKEELAAIGKTPQQPMYYPYPANDEEQVDCISYGKFTYLFTHR